MKISKAWLVGLLGYVAYFVKQLTGYDVSDEMIDMVLLAIALVPMFMNMSKSKTAQPTANEPVTRPQDVDPDKFIQG